MRLERFKTIQGTALGLAASLFAISAVSAQTRIVLPQGSVIVVRTTNPIESSTARVGQTFETVVDQTLGIDNYTVIPAGSRIQGRVAFAQPATRQQSGVIEVDFNQLTLTDGTSFPIQGRLTSLDSVERRQIESSADQRVVLVGGRGGIGAAIAGAGSQSSSTSGLLGALGALLSEGRNVSVPAGTPLAVQLEQRVVLRGRGIARAPDAFTIYTAADRIAAAQRTLAQRNYYRGAIDGTLNDATRRALFEFQLEQGIVATGNLDGRTADALGVSSATTGGVGSGSVISGNVLSAADASIVRRAAQASAARVRQELLVSTMGRLDQRRAYTEADLDLWFALSAFADNAVLYEQLVRASGRTEGAAVASRSLVNSARRVDEAMQRARPSQQTRNAWNAIRSQLRAIDSSFYTQ
ncbi:MAG: peptidoglycan-binding domain-containing protein [Gemmatimonadales bacterium]